MQLMTWTPHLACTIILTHIFPSTTLAYVGPGAGLSAIGAFFALIAGIMIAMLGFLWYPIKKLLRKKKFKKNQ